MQEFETQPLSELLQIRRDKLTELQEVGLDPFAKTVYDRTHMVENIIEHFDSFEGQNVKVAGRLMSKRGMGKVLFCDLIDRGGKIQLFIKIDAFEPEEFERIKKYDIGDIVGCAGEVFRGRFGTQGVLVRRKIYGGYRGSRYIGFDYDRQ